MVSGNRERHARGASNERQTLEVPLAELFDYASDLRSITQGRGTVTMAFSRNAGMPQEAQEAQDRVLGRLIGW